MALPLLSCPWNSGSVGRQAGRPAAATLLLQQLLQRGSGMRRASAISADRLGSGEGPWKRREGMAADAREAGPPGRAGRQHPSGWTGPAQDRWTPPCGCLQRSPSPGTNPTGPSKQHRVRRGHPPGSWVTDCRGGMGGVRGTVQRASAAAKAGGGWAIWRL